MNKLAWLLLSLVLLLGCDKDDGGDPPDPEPVVWNAYQLWDSGSKPVASPDGERILFLEEGVNGGLYLLEGGAASKLNESGPAVRSDYTWSADGSRICFSGPGLPGEASAGIYISTNAALTEYTRIWDRGSQPVFADDDAHIFCAGPEGTDQEGIWKITLANNERVRIIEKGVSPDPSPDGTQIAYLFTAGSSVGRMLVVFDRNFLTYDTLGTGAVNFTWTQDSRFIVYESVMGDDGFSGESRLFKIDVENGVLPGDLLFAGGREPMALPNDSRLVFTAFGGDQALGIWLTNLSGGRTQLSDSGATPFPVSAARIVASGELGLFELRAE